MTTSRLQLRWEQTCSQLRLFGLKFIFDWSFSLSALIAYYLLISVLPLVMSIFAVIILIFGDDTTFLNDIRDRLLQAFPKEGVADVVNTLIQSIMHKAGIIFALSFVVAVFSGSRLFIGIDDVLTIVYRIRERTILDQNVQGLKILFAFVILAPFIIVISSIPALMKAHQGFYHFLVGILGGLLAFTLFNLIYRVVPKRKMSFRNTCVDIHPRKLVGSETCLVSRLAGAARWWQRLVWSCSFSSFPCTCINS